MTTQNWRFALLVAGLATAATLHAQQIGVNATSSSNSGATFSNPTGAALPPSSFTGSAAAASNSNVSFGISGQIPQPGQVGSGATFQPPGSINANAGVGNAPSGAPGAGGFAPNANVAANGNQAGNANIAANANVTGNANVAANANLAANANQNPAFAPNGRFDPSGNYYPAGSTIPAGRFDQNGMFIPNPAFNPQSTQNANAGGDVPFQPNGRFDSAGNFYPAGSTTPIGRFDQNGMFIPAQPPSNPGTFNTNAPGFSNGNLRTVVPAGNDMQGFFPGNQTPASLRNGNLIVTNGNVPTDTGGVLR